MMKKTISIFITLIASFSTGFSQRSIELIPFDPGKLTGSPLARFTIDEPQTPLATAQRCIAAANYLDGTLYDTLRHYYSGLRGTSSRKDFPEPINAHDSVFRTHIASGTVYLGGKVRYDNQDRFIHGDYYSHLPPHAYIGSDTASYNSTGVRTFYEYDIDNPASIKQYQLIINNDAGKVIKDTFYQNAYANNFNWINADNYAYDVNNRQTLHSNYVSYNNYTTTQLTITKSFYNGSSSLPYLDSITQIVNNNINAASKKAIYHFYNTSQQLIADTIYNQNGSLSAAQNYIYTGNELTAITRIHNNGNWTLSTRTISRKNNEGLQTRYEQQNWNGSSGWQMVNGDSAVFNNAGYLIERTSYNASNNNIVIRSKQTIVRNNFNNPTLTIYKTYDQQGVLIEERKGAYYYTEYERGTGIAHKTKKLDVVVFPNPAKNKVSIKIQDEVKPVNIKLIDLNGKVVLQQFFHKPDATIYLDNLASGVYQLVLSTTDNNAHFTQKIVKQ